jgi:hypothetical protein
MKPREISVVQARIIEPARGPRGGVHLSDILNYIRKKQDARFAEALTESDFHRFKMGEGFEAGVMSRGLAINIRDHHECRWPGYTLTLNGVEMTTDAVCIGCEKYPLVWEIKLTWFGTKKECDAPEFRTYHYQLMAYVYALQLEMQRRVMGRFVFGYTNGDYMKERKPIIRAWDCLWSERELHDNWRMLMGVLEEMESLGIVKRAA